MGAYYLMDANLRCANLRGANLMDANLRCANLMGANLRCAKYNEETKFPDGFAPVASGMVLID
jgi:uncharacterized protein YjbI with pentapeptide repeats